MSSASASASRGRGVLPLETGSDTESDRDTLRFVGMGITGSQEQGPDVDPDEEIDYEWTKKKRLCLTFTDNPPVTTTFKYCNDGDESYRAEMLLDEICARINALKKKGNVKPNLK